jgi:hypothetical protein
MRTTKLFLALLVAVSIFSSCTKDNNSNDGILSGDLIGYVKLYEVDGTALANNSGVTVAVEGRNISATTDSTGRYVFTGLRTGTYNLTFTKSGYGTGKEIGYQFVGGGKVFHETSSISKIPSFKITKLTASTNYSERISFTVTLSGTLPSKGAVAIFVGTTPSVSSDPANYIDYAIINLYSSTSTSANTSIYTSNLASYGISKGQTVYITAYSAPYNYYAGSYTDLATGRSIFPALDFTPSNVVSVVVP